MRKVLIIGSILIFVFSIAACGGSKNNCKTKGKQRTEMGWI
ncbi:hypothetical protein N9J24_01790 [Bacteroidia bacterium]|nr:hypothetical protein [Bacteroidia bacterium]